MKIPKSFKLFSTTITVEYNDEKMNDMDAYGISSYGESKIILAKNGSGLKFSEGKMNDTFYHEKVHIILNTMNYNELSKDEVFVDVFAKLWRQSDETAKY